MTAPHGTNTRYCKCACRCGDCREAHRMAKADYSRRQRAKRPPKPVRLVLANRPCECGCGQIPSWPGSRFRQGHNLNAHAPLRERLLSGLAIDPSGCVVWTRTTWKGYGQIQSARGDSGERRLLKVHRLMYEMFVGPIPDGYEPDHLCHTNDLTCPGGIACPHRRCASPAHMELVTGAENSRRGNASRPQRRAALSSS